MEAFAYLAYDGELGKLIHANLLRPTNVVEPLCLLESPGHASRNREVSGAALEVHLIEGRRLTQKHLSAWRQLQKSNPELANPCFAPEFTQAVASVRNDVEVAFILDNGAVAGILPFQRRFGSRAIPAGGIVSDFQGLVCRPGFTCEPRELLKACGLVSWDFDRLLASQSLFAPYHKLCEPSARIDLREGYAAYATEREAAGTRQIRQCHYLMRRMAREIGPLTFVCHSPDPRLLMKVLSWKSLQYRRSGWKDMFAAGWGRTLVESIHYEQTTGLKGTLSLLYAGPHLVAGHMGMRSATVWHYWFPAYDRRFARYSPGLILLLKMAQAADQLGVQWIDIGTGMALYKKRLMNACVPVAEGSVERPAGLGLVRLARRRVKAAFRRIVSGT